jgi:tetratricopeptide (TPR) repeat protein
LFAFGALLNHELGDFEAAAELSGQARELAQEKGFVYWVAISTIIAGSCGVARDATDEATATVLEGLTLLKTIGDRSIYIHYMSYLANAYLRQRRPSDAVSVLLEALGLARTHIARFCEPELLRLLGEGRAALGDLDAARDCLQSALELSRSQGAHLYELRIALTHAQLLDSTREGGSALAQARGKFSRTVQFPLLTRVDQFLESARANA